MKKLLLATLMGLMFGTAQAEDLTLTSDKTFKVYGSIDAGLVTVSNAGTKNGQANILLNGVQKSSRFGITGSQAIDENWTAGYKMEHQFMVADGSNGSTGGGGVQNNFFNLNSHIYLTNPAYGKLVVGRQNSIVYESEMQTDARGAQNFGGSLSFWAENAAFGGTSTAKTGVVSLGGGNQINNLIRYELPEFAGVKLSGMYAPGGVGGDDDASAKKGLSVIYKGIDNLTLTTSGYWQNDASGVETARTWIVGGNYWMLDKKLNVAAGYISLENPSKSGLANSELSMKQLSAKYYVTPKFDISGGWYKLDDEVTSANSARQLSLVGSYALGKNIDAFAGWAQMKNTGNFGMAPFAQGALNYNTLATDYKSAVVTVPGQTHDALMVGMSIRF